MESVKRYKAMVNLPDGVLVADVYLSEDFDRVTAEREALQLLLNNLDDQLTSLEQRRYAEQQAREAAERRVEELEQSVELHAQVIRDQEQMIQNHRLENEKLEIEVQDLHGVVQRLNAARRPVCPNISGGTADRQDAGVDALNPAAEAVSHDE